MVKLINNENDGNLQPYIRSQKQTEQRDFYRHQFLKIESTATLIPQVTVGQPAVNPGVVCVLCPELLPSLGA